MSDSLNTRGFTTLVAAQAAVVQGRTGRASLDLAPGSALRAILEAFASVALWLQGLVLQVLARARLSTANGADVDSFVADYGMTRLPATVACGRVSFARFSPDAAALVPVGARVATDDGSQGYEVIVDAANPAYVVAAGGYPVAAGVAAVTASVRALAAGAAGNAAAGTVTALATGLPGIDSCSNGAGFSGGADAETDAALRARFAAYIASLARATRTAVGYAISTVQQGVTWTLTEGANPDGSANPGFFFVVVDDGTGTPPASLLTAVAEAIEGYRALGVRCAVYAPSVVTARITLVVTATEGYDATAVRAAVRAAIVAMVNALPTGAALPFYRVAATAFATDGVANVAAVTLNGATADLGATPLQVIRTSLASVTVS
ncbi:Baseplate protein [Rhodovastum atsumiense]|uniref:Baseplate protein n=1 Tax=Rhodovastum atsumiense TaxID=504468 RepID=A0A5M6IYR8_9PROT|nr:baseplate J/gp47 family protein [Rhodovastum atsumiense]KAA5613486.1 baseplate protein [Rhodovastum atsumiense]CAH2603230.1 Baseplate protein [Rhodovastum atsumiense]